MIGTQTPPHEQGREYDRFASASVRELDVDGSPIVAVMIDEDSTIVERVELRREDVWVIRRDRDEVVRWTRPGGERVEVEPPGWGQQVLRALDLTEVL